MSEQQAAKTPLLDLLRYTPIDAVAQVTTPTSSKNIPYGRLCHEAADELQAMQERIKALIGSMAEQELIIAAKEHRIKALEGALLAEQQDNLKLRKAAEWGELYEDIATQATNSGFKRWEDYVRIQTEFRNALRAAGGESA